MLPAEDMNLGCFCKRVFWIKFRIAVILRGVGRP